MGRKKKSLLKKIKNFILYYGFLLLEYMQERRKRKLRPRRQPDPSRKARRRRTSLMKPTKPKGKIGEDAFYGSDAQLDSDHEWGPHLEPEACENRDMAINYECSYCKKPGSRGHTRQPITSSGPHFECQKCKKWFSTFGKNPDPAKFKFCMYCSFHGVKVDYREVMETSKLSSNVEVAVVKDYEVKDPPPTRKRKQIND